MMVEQSKRIQASILNSIEKKVLVWLAGKQPSWVTSNKLTFIGVLGAIIIGVGFMLSDINISWLWLASFGFVVNWYGDSLDGNLARFRNTQRPVYGYYLDHMVDVFNELVIFVGLGLSSLMDLRIALAIYAAYLMMTIIVSINAHLRSEFKISYAGLGPTEFRLIAIIANTILIFSKNLLNFRKVICGVSLTALDLAGIVVTMILVILVIITFFMDLRYYAKIDPPQKSN